MTVVTTDEDLDEEKIKNPDKELQYPFTYGDNYVQMFISIKKDCTHCIHIVHLGKILLLHVYRYVMAQSNPKCTCRISK